MVRLAVYRRTEQAMHPGMGKRWPPAGRKLAVSVEEAAEALHVSVDQACT
jgi:hypothetical protein